ncbi:hypothetical protein NN561_018777 [Cricetulus griseus]
MQATIVLKIKIRINLSFSNGSRRPFRHARGASGFLRHYPALEAAGRLAFGKALLDLGDATIPSKDKKEDDSGDLLHKRPGAEAKDLVLLLAVFNEEQHFGHVVPLLTAHFVLRGLCPVRGGAGLCSGAGDRKDSPTPGGEGAGTRPGKLEPARRATGSSYGGHRKGRDEGGVTRKAARVSSSQVFVGSLLSPSLRLSRQPRR